MSDDVDRASFLASFPAIQSAIKRSGDNSGMRIQLDIPESEMAQAVKILAWGQTRLRVTIEPETESVTECNYETEKGANQKRQ